MFKYLTIILFFTSFGITDSKTYIKTYHPNGKLKEEGWILNDKKTDYWFYYYENGNKKEEGHYVNNQKTKWWIYYDDKETILKKCEHKNNELNGLTIIYSKGKISKAEKYANGKKVKTWTDLNKFKRDNINF
jgi:antitoxin component YwqK of YwqJK toxin-antitoxin module